MNMGSAHEFLTLHLPCCYFQVTYQCQLVSSVRILITHAHLYLVCTFIKPAINAHTLSQLIVRSVFNEVDYLPNLQQYSPLVISIHSPASSSHSSLLCTPASNHTSKLTHPVEVCVFHQLPVFPSTIC